MRLTDGASIEVAVGKDLDFNAALLTADSASARDLRGAAESFIASVRGEIAKLPGGVFGVQATGQAIGQAPSSVLNAFSAITVSAEGSAVQVRARIGVQPLIEWVQWVRRAKGVG